MCLLRNFRLRLSLAYGVKELVGLDIRDRLIAYIITLLLLLFQEKIRVLEEKVNAARNSAVRLEEHIPPHLLVRECKAIRNLAILSTHFHHLNRL